MGRSHGTTRVRNLSTWEQEVIHPFLPCYHRRAGDRGLLGQPDRCGRRSLGTKGEGLDSETNPEVTELLLRWREGDADALQELAPLVYDELKRIAQRHMGRERLEHTLGATALVNEAFIKLIGNPGIRWNDRGHFFSMASRLMRRVLVDHARKQRAAKRGGEAQRIRLEELDESAATEGLDVLDLHEALEELGRFDPEKAQLIEMRYFGGLTLEEMGDALGRTTKQVWQACQVAQAWLHRRVRGEGSHGP